MRWDSGLCECTSFWPNYCIVYSKVPMILNALQRSVQAVLVGKIQIQDWFGNGIKRAALMNKWVLKEVNIDEDEHCLLQTDGSFLYLLCKDGLYKVGSGYSGTVRVRPPSVHLLPKKLLFLVSTWNCLYWLNFCLCKLQICTVFSPPVGFCKIYNVMALF